MTVVVNTADIVGQATAGSDYTAIVEPDGNHCGRQHLDDGDGDGQ